MSAKNVVIVESPTKAKTISRFLGKTFTVKASFGHVRDLPKSEIGVELEHGTFLPRYVIPTAARKTVTELKKTVKNADHIYFATDEDREGEAISWHLKEVLAVPDEKSSRITFHEITKEAIDNALKSPRQIDERLVDAQQARRVLDRLVGYELSPLLWRKIRRGLSAGRVQSVAVRLIVEREREIQAFQTEEYWTVEAVFANDDDAEFSAILHTVAGRVLEKFSIRSAEEAAALADEMRAAAWKIAKIEKKEIHRSPNAPYITSSLQQDANRRLGMSAKQTMVIAQQLYEGVDVPGEGSVGLITYMRTDSVNLSESFLKSVRPFIEKTFGRDYLPDKARRFSSKSKLAQEAHEAIRPTDIERTPESIKASLDPAQFKLYDLIWRRALASQMKEALLEATSLDVSGGRLLARATGSVVVFPGFLAAIGREEKDSNLPALRENETVRLRSADGKQHFTEPPPRYSDASLVKSLEERGIGRPSTYAPTISTIIERGYAERIEGRRLKPTDIAFLVNDLLVEHFPKIVDYEFTANMEDDLDNIAEGKAGWIAAVREFYRPFHENLSEKEKVLTKKALTEEATDIKCEKCGQPMVIKMGRFGKFLACSGYPGCKNTKPLNKEGGVAEPIMTQEKCPECGELMAEVQGRFGRYLRCSKSPECKGVKKIEKKTGVNCPKCKEGEIVEKRSKRGRTFFGCNRYPKCDFALWNRPTGEKCPRCGALLTIGAKGAINCSNKECGYQAAAE